MSTQTIRKTTGFARNGRGPIRNTATQPPAHPLHSQPPRPRLTSREKFEMMPRYSELYPGVSTKILYRIMESDNSMNRNPYTSEYRRNVVPLKINRIKASAASHSVQTVEEVSTLEPPVALMALNVPNKIICMMDVTYNIYYDADGKVIYREFVSEVEKPGTRVESSY